MPKPTDAQKEITLKVRTLYGRDLFYPTNDIGLKLARWLGTKTFRPRDIEQAKSLGYSIRYTFQN